MAGIRLIIRHPVIDPDVISQQLGIEAQWSQKQGAERSTPAGRKLPGNYAASAWSYAKKFGRSRKVVSFAAEFIQILEENFLFIQSIVDDGGTLLLTFDLDGSTNVGGTLTWQMLDTLSRLRVNVGFEVFPSSTQSESD